MERHDVGVLIWAVDISAPADGGAQPRTLEVVRRWSDALQLDIQPAYVCPPQAAAPSAAALSKLQDQWAGILAKAGSKGLRELVTLFSKDRSLNAAVDALLQYADESRAAAIALATHARTGPQRWLLGSFTEAVLLRSRIPLLTLSPASQPGEALKSILLPTDLSPGSAEEFGFIIDEAKRLDLDLTLLHCSRMDYEYPEASYGPPGDCAQFRSDYLERKRSQLRDNADLARAKGLTVKEIFVDRQGETAQTILEAAISEKVDAIAMVSRSGPLEAALGASVTRQVIRSAHCPVWAIHVQTPPPHGAPPI